jgi:hypothetical protein
MKNYCCQVFSISGKVLETFYEDYLEAARECTKASDHATQAFVFHYSDMKNPICAARVIK